MVIEIIFFGAGVAKKHKTLYEVRGVDPQNLVFEPQKKDFLEANLSEK